jgi:hypothetical protein
MWATVKFFAFTCGQNEKKNFTLRAIIKTLKWWYFDLIFLIVEVPVSKHPAVNYFFKFRSVWLTASIAPHILTSMFFHTHSKDMASSTL